MELSRVAGLLLRESYVVIHGVEVATTQSHRPQISDNNDMKVGIIIEQEYRNKVAKKSFIILTILMPLLMAALIIVPLKLAQLDSDEDGVIAVVDQTGLYHSLFLEENDEDMKFMLVDQMGDSIGDFRAFVVIDEDLAVNPNAVKIYSEKTVSRDVKSYVEQMLSQYVEHKKLEAYNIEGLEQMIADSKTEVTATTIKMSDDGNEENSDADIASLIGILATTLIYMFIFISGSKVMSAVVQEKVNRIVEVLVCSVKPWELMWGKIIAVALVCLTQMAIWVVLTSIFVGVGMPMAGLNMSELSNAPAAGTTAEDLSAVQSAMSSLLSINWGMLISMFILYFIGGYLLYASVFAAVGAAVDNESDTGSMMMPVTLVVLFALYAGIYSATNPDGPLAFWCSIIPFTSPIVMMVRLPFGVDAWQLIVSLLLLAATVVGMVWLAGRIYRVGILTYGKKMTFSDMIKIFKK